MIKELKLKIKQFFCKHKWIKRSSMEGINIAASGLYFEYQECCLCLKTKHLPFKYWKGLK
jgi:hypothetical protein